MTSGLANSIKNLLQSIIILALSGRASSQVFIVLLIEVLYFGHTLFCNVKVRLSVRIVDIVTEVLFMGYLIAKLVTTMNIDEDTRQKGLATSMVVCVYGIIAISISLALYSLILTIFHLIKRLITEKNGKRTSRVYSVIQHEIINNQDKNMSLKLKIVNQKSLSEAKSEYGKMENPENGSFSPGGLSKELQSQPAHLKESAGAAKINTLGKRLSRKVLTPSLNDLSDRASIHYS